MFFLKDIEYTLVTGSIGFIGSHTCKKLLMEGYDVVGIDNFSTYYDPALKQYNLKLLETFDNFKFINADICNYENLFSVVKDHSIKSIVHLAAQAGIRYSLKNPFIYQQVNVGGTLNLLELSRHLNCSKFIFASSSSVYGNQRKVPFSETDPISKPVSIYAATKQAGESLCYAYHHLYDININCLRFFTVYGPSGRPDMSPHIFTRKILNGEKIQLFDEPSGTIKRDYTYVSDIVTGMMESLHYDDGFQIFNIGYGKPIKLLDFVAIIEELTGKTANIEFTSKQPGDVDVTFADITKAKKHLGFHPEIEPKEGMERYLEWFRRYYGY